jgi:hypothetical protein
MLETGSVGTCTVCPNSNTSVISAAAASGVATGVHLRLVLRGKGLGEISDGLNCIALNAD